MRIVQLTPGTGSFYCGTCIRDNALVAALRRLGHDAVLAPLYLPPSLDEESTAGQQVFYGGVKVYLQQKLPFLRRLPRWLDAMLDSPWALSAAAKRSGSTDPADLGDITLSVLRGEEGFQNAELDRLVDWLATEFRPDAVMLSNALLMGMGRRIREGTGARVYCTLQGEDYFLDLLREPWRTHAWKELGERSRHLDGFIGVSRYYADVLIRRAALDPARTHVVHNGILLEGFAPAPCPPEAPTIGYLARMCALKGLDTLVEAFILLRKRGNVPNARLHVAGTMTKADERFVEEQKRRLRDAGLLGEARFDPNISREGKVRFLQGLSVLSVPALYGESFGLYILEALACGVPVVQPRHAAFPEVLEATGGGTLYEPTGAEPLARALEDILLEPERARALGEEGRRNVIARYGVERMASEVAEILAGGAVGAAHPERVSQAP
jgi:glycosyltransferase involved in cell wall biosynthesis